MTRPRRVPVPAACLAAAAWLLATAGACAAATTTGLDIPADPLITESQVPPNVLFILDDSGSMGYGYMPDEVPRVGTTSAGSGVFDNSCDSYTNNAAVDYLACSAYPRNTLYYNPATTYTTWTLPDGSQMSGGTSYTAAYSDTLYVPYSGTGPAGNGTVTTTSASVNLQASVRTFFVPKDTTSTDSAVYLATATNYYRYQILTDGTIYRSEYLAYTQGNTGSTAAAGGCATTTSGYGWRNCTRATPAGRSEAAERSNYATWYSYHRTRNKAAKAGASKAFAELGEKVRVGFRTIAGRSTCGGSSGGNCTYSYAGTYNLPTQSVPIPVNYNNGLFSDTGSGSNTAAYNNRTQWYNRLFSATASSSTPLRNALQTAGNYFSASEATGPYGPEAGTAQYVCRQNFTILTTDGYWNESYSNATIGNADNTSGATLTSPSGTSYTYTPVNPYKDGYSQTLADVAMYYWKNDLRTDLSNSVPTTSADPAFWQHMTTFALGLGLSGTVDQTSVDAVLAKGYATVKGVAGWPQPVNNTVTTIDDLLHAAVNGHGEYVGAADPDEFAEGLTAALAAVVQRTGAFANVAATSTSLSSDTQLFVGSYVAGVWTGQLVACAATVSSCNASTASWLATAQLPAASARTVLTYEASAGASFPTATQKAALGGSDIADYLRGDQSKELQNGGSLRNRATVLGDIVDSSPVYVSASNTVYVGANDGMLHAFNAATGAELFAYVPGALSAATLATLASADYGHAYFVDGPLVVSTQKQTSARNVLVGALGRGGKGLYALDVTRPAAIAKSDVLWEATETPGGNLGKILGKPFIARLNNGVVALVTGNGVNSSTGHAVLLVYNLLTGALIRELDTGSGGTTSATSNGLFAPSGWDQDSSGTVDYVYAGDLKGQVWKFDLSASTAGSWSVGNGAKALFSATDASGTAQPITGGVALAENPSTLDTWVFFGTGRYLLDSDINDLSVQALYGVIDGGATVARSALTQRAIVASGTVSGYSVRSFQANAALPSGSKGWYLNLLTAAGVAEGERIVSAPQLSGKTLVVSSIIPSGDACQSDGSGYLNSLDAFTGTSTAGGSYFDLNANGSTADDTLSVGGSAVAVGSVAVTSGMVGLASLLNGKAVVGDSSGATTAVATSTISASRVSWREALKEK